LVDEAVRSSGEVEAEHGRDGEVEVKRGRMKGCGQADVRLRRRRRRKGWEEEGRRRPAKS
jgi:hypothetical protein